MKQKIFWVALMAMMFMVKHSSYGQTPVGLQFSNNEATIATNDQNYRIPTTFIENLPQNVNVSCTLREVQEVRSAHAQVGLDSNIFQWTTSPPVGGGGDVNNSYVQLNQPGLYIFLIMRKSDGAIWHLKITVSYISWPAIWSNGTKMGNLAHNGTQFHYASGITSTMFPTEQSGGYINLKPLNATGVIEARVSNVFVNIGTNWLNINGNEVAMNQTSYNLSQYGSCVIQVNTRDGHGPNPTNIVNFSLTMSNVQYTLTAIAGSGGTISPSGNVTVNQGESKTFTATPDNGKMIDEWKVDGNVVASSGNTYTVSNVQANATIQVTFKDIPSVTFTLTALAGSGGIISPNGSVIVKQGESKTFTATPDNGKMVDQWKVDGNVVASAGNTYTVSNVQANATVQVTFKDIPPVTTYTLTVNSGKGSGNYEVGAVVTIEANTAPSGKTFDKWTGDVSGIADVNVANTTYKMGNANATITATYKDGSQDYSWLTQPTIEFIVTGNSVEVKAVGPTAETFNKVTINGVEIPQIGGKWSIDTSSGDIWKVKMTNNVNVILSKTYKK